MNQTDSLEFLHRVETLKIEVKQILNYEKNEHDKNELTSCLLKLDKEITKKNFFMTVLTLASYYVRHRKVEQVRNVCGFVDKNDDLFIYNSLQFIIAQTYRSQKKFYAEEQCLSSVFENSDTDMYIKLLSFIPYYYYDTVLVKFINNLIHNPTLIKDAYGKISNIKEEYIRVIFEKLKNVDDGKYQKELLKLLQCYLIIRKELLVVEKENEHYFAHYTEASTAVHFMQKEDSGEHWNFRLSEASQLNDPEEGKVLLGYINNLPETEQTEIAVFVASFSFNHDCLNQFRLYGKKQNQEATGVSVLFKPDFFSTAHDVLNLNTANKLLAWSNSPLGKEIDNNTENTRLPLYRCIYFDPESIIRSNEGEIPYIRIACCDERSFYMQKDKNMDELEKYNERIKQIENNVLEQLNNIKNTVKSILQSSSTDEIIELIKIILLPLSYLIKHAAYREEQECRIIQCCSFNDERIDKTGFKDAKIYLPYAYPIKENTIERVYLSKGAENYKKIFQLLGLKEENVRISSNPFRIVSEK